MKRRHSTAALLFLAAISSQGSFAHSDVPHARKVAKPIAKDQHAWGREGDPARARHTVTIDMSDTMRFAPDKLDIRTGDTVKIVVRNQGKTMHELVIGTESELKAHAEVMKKHPGMEHDEPYMAHVAPGKQEVITWQFTQSGDFMFGCLIPGHFEAGMVGRIKVSP